MLGIVVHSHQVEAYAAYSGVMKSPHLDQIDVVCDHSDPAQGLGRLLQRLQQHAIVNAEKTGLHHDSTPDACFARKRAPVSERCRVSRLVTGAGTALPGCEHMEVAITGGRAGDAT